MIRHVVLIASALLNAAVTSAEDWPQFRGRTVRGFPNCPKVFRPNFLIRRTSAGRPAWGMVLDARLSRAGRVFTSAMVDDKTIGLFAFDAVSGKSLWERTWPAGDLPDIHKTNSHASTTPVADSERVYFYFSTLGMVAVDAKDGTDVWRQELPEPYFVFKWGAGMSPVLYKDMLLFVQDDDLAPAFYAFDKVTGQVRWKDDRSDMAVNYSHPVICSTDHGDEIIVAGTGLLVGYDPETGKRRWYARTLLRNIKTTPVVENGVIYISLQSGGIANQWLASVDRAETGNSDGKLTREEIQAFVGDRPVPEAFYQKTFGRGDVNEDGQLEGEELDKAFLHPDNFAGADFTSENPAEEFIMAVRGGGRGDVTESHVLWRHETKHTDHIVSPLIVNGRMLLVKGGGIATCFGTQKGENLFGPVRIRNESNYFASPVYADGKIFAAGENGRVVVMRDAAEPDILAVNDVGSSVLGTPAIANNTLFIRTRTTLLAIAAGE